MPVYQQFLYAIWFAIPVFFFLAALWSKLEQIGKSPRRQNPGDLLRQGTFMLGCVIVAILLDQYALPEVGDALPSWLPLGVVQVLLLPVVLLIAAKLVGGAKPIKIEKAPRPSQRRRS